MKKLLLLLPVLLLLFTGSLHAQIFTEDFAYQERVLETWDIIDANEDGNTWEWTLASSGSGTQIPCMRYKYHRTNDADDYLVMKEPLTLRPGEYSFKLSYQVSDDDPERFEILYGTSNDVTTMTFIGGLEEAKKTNWIDIVFDFDVSTEDNYYFAIHVTSPKFRFYLDITDIVIDGDPIILPADLHARNITMPVNGCGLSNEEIVEIEVRNIGSGVAESFSAIYTINEGEPQKQHFDISIEPGETKIVELTALDFSLPDTYTIVVVLECENEENTDNNSISGQVTNIESVPAPYQVSALTAYEESLWSMGEPDAWQYNELYDEWWAADQEVPLYTNCIYLEEAAYRISFDYQAGLEFIGRNYLQDFDVYIGESRTDISEWEKIVEYKNHYTQEQYWTYEKIVNITASGSYRIAFVGKNGIDEHSYLAIKEIRVSQPYEHDIMLGSFSSQTLASSTPVSQVNGEHVFVSEIRNRGTLEESVTLEVLLKNEVIYTEVVSLASEEVKTMISRVSVETEVEIGDELTFTARVSVENDQTPDDNELSLSTSIEKYFARDTWIQESDYDFSGGIGFEEPVGMGPEFTLVNADKLTSYTVAFTSNANDLTAPIGIAVYKKGERFVVEEYVFYESEEPIVFETVNRVEEGFTDLKFSAPVVLEPGTYFFVVEQLTNESIGVCSDRATDGEFYVTAQYENTYYAQYQRTHYGNVILRANFNEEDGPVSIAQTGNDTMVSIQIKDGLVLVNADDKINSVTIVNAYGTILYHSGDGLSVNEIEINQNGLSTGIYIAQIQTAKGTQNIKFVIK